MLEIIFVTVGYNHKNFKIFSLEEFSKYRFYTYKTWFILFILIKDKFEGFLNFYSLNINKSAL